MKEKFMEIWCCGCNKDVSARLVKGNVIYPHRKDLYQLNFWQCDDCKGFVGCHNKMKSNPIKPLGCIPTKEIKNARNHIHRILDPLWKKKKIKRKDIYRKISCYLGYEYHTAEIKDINEARKIYRFIRELQI